MSSNDNNVRNVLRPVEDFITRSHTEFNDAIHKVLLPSLMNSSFALHSLKESLNDGIYEYGEQRFRDGVRSVESGESRIQLDVVQPSSSLSPSPSPRRLDGVSGLSDRSENVKHVKREELEPENDGKSQIIQTLTAKLVASQKRISELQSIISEKEKENKADTASAAKCVQLWKENGELLEKYETIVREAEALKVENNELKKEKSKAKILVVDDDEDDDEEPASDTESEAEPAPRVENVEEEEEEDEAEEEEAEEEEDEAEEEEEEVEEEEEDEESEVEEDEAEEEEEEVEEAEEEEEDEEEEEEDEEAEVEEYEYNGKNYYIMSKDSGPVYECLSDGDIGDEIGKIVKGTVYLKGPSVKGKQVWVKA